MTIYAHSASLDFPVGVFPCLSLTERNRALEKRFDFGIYDCGINDLAKYGEYQDWSLWPPKPSLHGNWVWSAPDYPWDVLKEYPGNTRTPLQCLEDTDANMEYYRHYDSVLLTVQYLFGDALSLRVRLKKFLDRFGVACFGIGNTCKLTNIKKQREIGRVIVEVCGKYNNVTPHVFGCPTELLKYLIHHARFHFSVDTNKYFWGTSPDWPESHRSRNKAERTRFLCNYLAKVGLPVTPAPVPRPYHDIKEWFVH